jgi:hypothetical protein
VKRAQLQQWAAVIGGHRPAAAQKGMVAVRDLPQVKDLEAHLLISTPVRGPLDPGAEQWAYQLAEKIFGVSRHEAVFGFAENLFVYDEPADDEELEYGVDDEEGDFEDDEVEEDEAPDHSGVASYQAKLHTLQATDDEVVEILRPLGLDFTDERGQPLRCTRLMAVQAEVAARGIAGKMPNQADISLTQWEDKLARDAEAFKTRKLKGQ